MIEGKEEVVSIKLKVTILKVLQLKREEMNLWVFLII
jgi:hypothetical protein